LPNWKLCQIIFYIYIIIIRTRTRTRIRRKIRRRRRKRKKKRRLVSYLYCCDVHGSMHHSTIHKEKSNKMQQCIKFYYSIFIWSSTCFGRHTAHHQEPKLHWQPLVFHTWKVVGRVVGGRCQTQCAWQRPRIVCKTGLVHSNLEKPLGRI
jgi:hypothetical protein